MYEDYMNNKGNKIRKREKDKLSPPKKITQSESS